MFIPIGCGGVAVHPGDIIVGDADGGCNDSRHLAEEVAVDAAEQESIEDFVLQQVQSEMPW